MSLLFNSKLNESSLPVKVLSIDVGIKNLSFCLFVKNPGYDYYDIEKWNTIDLTEQEVVLCQELDKNKNVCNKEAKFTKHEKCFCLKHSKKSSFILPDPELKRTKLKNYNITELKEFVLKYQIEIYSLPFSSSPSISSKKITATNPSKKDII